MSYKDFKKAEPSWSSWRNGVFISFCVKANMNYTGWRKNAQWKELFMGHLCFSDFRRLLCYLFHHFLGTPKKLFLRIHVAFRFWVLLYLGLDRMHSESF